MSRNSRIAVGLLAPSVIALGILGLTYSSIKNMESVNPVAVLIMLAFIVTSVASSVFTAYYFKDLSFKSKQDVALVYLNTYPWVLFIVLFSDRFWILTIPILITPILGYWFGKRYFSM